jgi:hypothetical protein
MAPGQPGELNGGEIRVADLLGRFPVAVLGRMK